MTKEILIQNHEGTLFVALTYFNKIEQFLFEKANQTPNTNDIYKGRILGSGEEVDLGEGFRGLIKHSVIPKEENNCLVQVLEKTDSDKIFLTKNIILKGYAVTYTPFNTQPDPTICIGKKNEYIQASEIIKGIKFNPNGGFIFHAGDKSREKKELNREAKFLVQLWKIIEDRSNALQTPALIYQDGTLLWRALRDLYDNRVDNIIVEGDLPYKETKDYIKHLVGPAEVKKVAQYKGSTSLFESKGIFDKAIEIYKSH